MYALFLGIFLHLSHRARPRSVGSMPSGSNDPASGSIQVMSTFGVSPVSSAEKRISSLSKCLSMYAGMECLCVQQAILK